MTKLAHIYDHATGETTVREMTADELATQALADKEEEQNKAAQKAKEQARDAVLAKLGLTADEAAALLG